MKWITRKDIKVDRVACTWLIKRFVDPQAEFLFVEEKDLLEKAKQEAAIPFDAPKIDAIKLNHRGPRCTFEAIVEDYSISDAAVRSLALIVRAADIKSQESVAPRGLVCVPLRRDSPRWACRMRIDCYGSSPSMMPCTLS